MVLRNMERSSVDLVDVLAFVRVVETGAFARAAERMGISKSILSRRVARLRIDLEMPIRSAARANAPVSTTRTKASTSTRSTEERSISCNTMMRDGWLPATTLGS